MKKLTIYFLIATTIFISNEGYGQEIDSSIINNLSSGQIAIAKDALKRLSKNDFSVKEKTDKLNNLINDFTEDKDKDFKLLKVKTSGD